jgi:hypothetical protein
MPGAYLCCPEEYGAVRSGRVKNESSGMDPIFACLQLRGIESDLGFLAPEPVHVTRRFPIGTVNRITLINDARRYPIVLLLGNVDRRVLWITPCRLG